MTLQCPDTKPCVCACTGCSDSIVELDKSGTPQRRITLPEDLRGSSNISFIFIPQVTLWSLASSNKHVTSRFMLQQVLQAISHSVTRANLAKISQKCFEFKSVMVTGCV